MYILAPKLFEKLKVEKWNQKFKVYLKTLAKRNPWIKIRDYQIVRKHFNFDKQDKSDFSLRNICTQGGEKFSMMFTFLSPGNSVSSRFMGAQ